MEILYESDYLVDRLLLSIDKKKQKFVPLMPNIIRRNRKTFIMNYNDVCVSIKRNYQDIKNHIETELQVESSISAAGSLIIDKMYDPKRIKDIFQKYIITYVFCAEPNCRGCTEIIKENRVKFLLCSACQSKRAIS